MSLNLWAKYRLAEKHWKLRPGHFGLVLFPTILLLAGSLVLPWFETYHLVTVRGTVEDIQFKGKDGGRLLIDLRGPAGIEQLSLSLHKLPRSAVARIRPGDKLEILGRREGRWLHIMELAKDGGVLLSLNETLAVRRWQQKGMFAISLLLFVLVWGYVEFIWSKYGPTSKQARRRSFA